MQEFRPDTYINGRYRIIRRIGEGGFAVVYAAYDHELGRNVALKFLKLTDFHAVSDLERFVREARTLSASKHPNIVSVFSCDTLTGGQVFIVMEYLEGITLSRLIETEGKLAPNMAGALFLQICRGVGYAHRQNIVHRDLSPSNIFLVGESPDYKVKVLDFGLAKSLSETDSITQTGAILGNPAYMSPELAVGNNVTQQSDIYSLGLIFYETLTGHCPFESRSPLGYIYLQKTEYPEDPQMDMPTENQEDFWKALILKCIQKEPADRFHSCQQLEEAIQNVPRVDDLLRGLPSNNICWRFHVQPGQAKKRKLSVLTAMIIICVLFSIAVYTQEQWLFAIARIINLVPGETSHFLETKFASYLISRKKLTDAVRVYEKTLEKDACSGRFQDYSRDSTALVSMQFLAGDSDSAFKSIANSLRVLKQHADREVCSDFVNSLSRFTQQHTDLKTSTVAELRTRASLLNFLIENKSESIERIRSTFNLLLKRSIEYAKGNDLPSEVFESLVNAISYPGFYLKGQELSCLRDLVHFSIGSRAKEVRELLKDSLANPGMSEEFKEDFNWIIITKLPRKERHAACLSLIRTARSAGIRSMALSMLAQDSMEVGDYRQALAFLEEDKKSTTYHEDKGLAVLKCQIGMGNRKAALKTLREMIRQCRQCPDCTMISPDSSIEQKLDLYRDIVGSYGTGFTMSYTYSHSAESLFINSILGAILLNEDAAALELADDLLRICDKYPWLIQTEQSRLVLDESIQLIKITSRSLKASTNTQLLVKLQELKRRALR